MIFRSEISRERGNDIIRVNLGRWPSSVERGVLQEVMEDARLVLRERSVLRVREARRVSNPPIERRRVTMPRSQVCPPGPNLPIMVLKVPGHGVVMLLMRDLEDVVLFVDCGRAVLNLAGDILQLGHRGPRLRGEVVVSWASELQIWIAKGEVSLRWLVGPRIGRELVVVDCRSLPLRALPLVMLEVQRDHHLKGLLTLKHLSVSPLKAEGWNHYSLLLPGGIRAVELGNILRELAELGWSLHKCEWIRLSVKR